MSYKYEEKTGGRREKKGKTRERRKRQDMREGKRNEREEGGDRRDEMILNRLQQSGELPANRCDLRLCNFIDDYFHISIWTNHILISRTSLDKTSIMTTPISSSINPFWKLVVPFRTRDRQRQR